MHTPALLDEASDGSPVSTLTPVYPLRFVERIHPWSSTSKWVDALGRTVFLALGSRQPKVADDLIDLKKSWDESDLDADEFSEWVSSFTLSGDFLDWCDDCGGPVFYPFIADGGAREVCESCLDGNYVTCDCCNERYPALTSVDDGDQKVCRHCLQNYYETCDESEEPVRDTEVTEGGDRYVCGLDDCYYCFDCCYYWCDCCDNHYEEPHDHQRED